MPSIQTSENQLTSVTRNKRHEKQLCQVMGVEDAGPVAVESQSESYNNKETPTLVDSRSVHRRTLNMFDVSFHECIVHVCIHGSFCV